MNKIMKNLEGNRMTKEDSIIKLRKEEKKRGGGRNEGANLKNGKREGKKKKSSE
jgi:hypothetical protein